MTNWLMVYRIILFGAEDLPQVFAWSWAASGALFANPCLSFLRLNILFFMRQVSLPSPNASNRNSVNWFRFGLMTTNYLVQSMLTENQSKLFLFHSIFYFSVARYFILSILIIYNFFTNVFSPSLNVISYTTISLYFEFRSIIISLCIRSCSYYFSNQFILFVQPEELKVKHFSRPSLI